MRERTYARVGDNSEAPRRVEDWRAVLETDDTLPKVPVTAPLPHPGRLPIGVREVFDVDMARLTVPQLRRLAETIARRFGVPLSEVAGTLETEGVALLADGCTVHVEGGLIP